MGHRVCPWWIGYFLVSPLRRLLENPVRILNSYVHPGMTVLEPGPGMGFFTLELARQVGPSGRVVAVDLQERMLAGLRRRAARAGLANRIDLRLAIPSSLRLEDLQGTVDFALAFAVVHEVPGPEQFFRDIAAALKPGGSVLLAEPSGHVTKQEFESELRMAAAVGLRPADHPSIRRNHAVLLRK